MLEGLLCLLEGGRERKYSVYLVREAECFLNLKYGFILLENMKCNIYIYIYNVVEFVFNFLLEEEETRF